MKGSRLRVGCRVGSRVGVGVVSWVCGDVVGCDFVGWTWCGFKCDFGRRGCPWLLRGKR